MKHLLKLIPWWIKFLVGTALLIAVLVVAYLWLMQSEFLDMQTGNQFEIKENEAVYDLFTICVLVPSIVFFTRLLRKPASKGRTSNNVRD